MWKWKDLKTENIQFTNYLSLKKWGKKTVAWWAALSKSTGDLTVMIRCGQQEYIRWLLTAVVILIVVAYLFYNNIWVMLVLSPYMRFYIKDKLREKEVVEKKRMAAQFKDAMMTVSFSLNVGYSIENAFRESVKELVLLYGENSMIVDEFKEIVRRIDNNENVEDVLCEFAKKCDVEDINYFVEVFRYAKRSGGDLIRIIKNTAGNIQQKLEVEEEVQTIISGKKLEQRVMSVIPLGMIVYLRLTSPQMMAVLYGNLIGVAVMTLSLILYVVAYYMAKKIVDIKV